MFQAHFVDRWCKVGGVWACDLAFEICVVVKVRVVETCSWIGTVFGGVRSGGAVLEE